MLSAPRIRRACIAVLLATASVGHADTKSDVARSDIALGQPNVLPSQAVGLGNGELGASFWSADGLTIQLNRIDALAYLPADRGSTLSRGQLFADG